MKIKMLKVLVVLCLSSFISCSQNETLLNSQAEIPCQKEKDKVVNKEPHKYGGWYCPDNLNGFPAVDIADWKDVPVVNGRMATEEEARNGASLILVDMEKYPNAKPLDMTMPKLAKFYNEHSNREEIVIVIQALNIDNDSIVGFRYLNGGNGSAWLHEVDFISDQESEIIHRTQFVSHDININAPQDVIWEVLTKPEYVEALQPTFDLNNKLPSDWWKTFKANYHYGKLGVPTSSYANKLYGNYYIQNDHGLVHYTEKFLLLQNENGTSTELKISCGPFGADYEEQKSILLNWAQKVKELSEKS